MHDNSLPVGDRDSDKESLVECPEIKVIVRRNPIGRWWLAIERDERTTLLYDCGPSPFNALDRAQAILRDFINSARSR